MLPFTIFPVLFPKENKQGLFPVRLSVTIGSKRSYVSTGIFIKSEDWDPDKRVVRKFVLQSVNYNRRILKQKSDIESKLTDLQVTGKEISIHSIRQDVQSMVITEYFDKLISEVQTKYSSDTINNYKFELKRLQEFDRAATFESVNHSWLRRYEAFLLEKGLANNTRFKAWKILRKVFNSAVSDKVTLNYPFKGFQNPKYKQTDRTHLTDQEVQALEDLLVLPLTTTQRTVLLYFLLGCYSGLRYSDWQRYNRKGFIKEGRLITRTKKTGDLVSMKIHNRLQPIIDQLDEAGKVPSEPKTNETLKVLQKMTEPKIEKTITCHVSRHSFAVRCAELDISIETTANLMGITIKSCQIYYKVTNRKTDSEVDKWNRK